MGHILKMKISENPKETFLTGLRVMILRSFSSKFETVLYTSVLTIYKLHVPYLSGFDMSFCLFVSVAKVC